MGWFSLLAMIQDLLGGQKKIPDGKDGVPSDEYFEAAQAMKRRMGAPGVSEWQQIMSQLSQQP